MYYSYSLVVTLTLCVCLSEEGWAPNPSSTGRVWSGARAAASPQLLMPSLSYSSLGHGADRYPVEAGRGPGRGEGSV